MLHRLLTPIKRVAMIAGLMAVVAVAHALISQTAFAQTAPADARNEVLIKNAMVMTATHGRIENGSVYVKDGKIVAVGKNVSAPASATVIDAGGKYLTPGIIDSHSHIALDDDVNEATSPVMPQMMMMDAFDYKIRRSIAGWRAE